MEAARTLIDLPERMRRRRFIAECEDLRPEGISYVRGHFGRALDLADAEDVVAEVIIRFDRLDRAGRPPDRLRPAFFTSVKNASLDLIRYRGVRPSAPLEAAASKTVEGPGPEERAESRENVVRLREAMARMHPNHREAIVLRFGLGLTVPQIAEHLGISLPAAKKRVLRSTERIRDRIEEIDGRRFCPEMREIARRSVLGGEIAEISQGSEGAAIRAHLEHCGACRSYLAALRLNLHELGSGVLLGGLVSGKLGLLGRVLSGFHDAARVVHTGADRVRLASYRASGALAPEGAGSAGILAGTGQKLAAVCTAGAASAATCLATGLVGPGLAVGPSHHNADPHPARPVAHVRQASTPSRRPLLTDTYTEPVSTTEESTTGVPAASPTPKPRGTAAAAEADPKPKPEPQHQPKSEPSTPGQTEQSQFGFEGESSTTAPTEEASASTQSAVTQSRSVEAASSPPSAAGETATSTGSAKSGGSSSGHDEFGFGG